MRYINWIALVLVIIGALNWGMVGFFEINVVTAIFSITLSRIIFAIIGIAGLWALSFFRYFEPRNDLKDKKD